MRFTTLCKSLDLQRVVATLTEQPQLSTEPFADAKNFTHENAVRPYGRTMDALNV